MASNHDPEQPPMFGGSTASPDWEPDDLEAYGPNDSEDEEEEEDDEDTDSGDASESSFEATFPYSREELVVIISNFYDFLTTFYLDESAVIYPPADGWPNLSPENTAHLNKTPFVVDLLRHLPYIAGPDRSNDTRIHSQCNVVNYSALSAEMLEKEALDFVWKVEIHEQLRPAAWPHTFLLADGYESGGRSMMLNTATGEMDVEMIGYQNDAIQDIEEYFDGLRHQYQTLELVPIPGHNAVRENMRDAPEGEELTEAPLRVKRSRSEPHPNFPTKQDVLWVRVLYRKFGWPGPSYRKKEALVAIAAFRADRERQDNEAGPENYEV